MHFALPSDWQGQSVWAYFDGIFAYSTFFLNSQFILSHFDGYNSFAVRLDNVTGTQYGPTSENVLAIYVDATETTSWWYAGGGIYRHAYLIATNPLHVVFDGVYAFGDIAGATVSSNGATPSAGASASSANLFISAELAWDQTGSATGSVQFVLFDASGNVVAQTTTPQVIVPSTGTATVSTNLAISSAVQLWSTPRPYSYTLQTTVLDVNGNPVDAVNSTVGFRSPVFTADDGFYLNGFALQHRGFCDHNDFEGVGMALVDRIHLFRGQALRSIGGNARRMSHNSPDPRNMGILNALGVMVLDENRDFLNTSQSFQSWHDLVKRDRNWPANIFWSECNESGCTFPANATAFVAQTYRTIAKALDPNRALAQNYFSADASTPFLPRLWE